MDHARPASFFDRDPAHWRERAAYITDVMREMSRQSDPQTMVRTYGQRMREIFPVDRFVSLSRRGLERPQVRVTRTTEWEKAGRDVNPWAQKDQLPLLDRGLLSDLIWRDEPTIIDELQVDPADPGAEFLEGMRSLVAVPIFDDGVAANMVVQLKRQPNGFRTEFLPEQIWVTNLFGRATNNLVLSAEVKRAYEAVDRELKVVAEIQHSLLPRGLPDIPGVSLAAHYSTSARAGGDYYDFFPLPGGDRWGVLIADVAGHGTPAAVLMAVTHSIAHSCPPEEERPGHVLAYLNRKLSELYTTDTGRFVTAFYGVYDTRRRTLAYANAGHGAPRVRGAGGAVRALGQATGLPLGIDSCEPYPVATADLAAGEAILLYTDGITETRDPTGELFGTARLDAVLAGSTGQPLDVVDATLAAVDAFAQHAPPADDRTLLALRLV
ncbi:MAG TPA: PP2C family protein-serine/threonine phosphatase [Tepidisphaeraceae bacterium]|nr:PP2C family protein-serine/threonine phosphatase [Tepidisphaeraceae bacterium]